MIEHTLRDLLDHDRGHHYMLPLQDVLSTCIEDLLIYPMASGFKILL